MLKELLAERKIPDFLSREEMLDILQCEEYGYMPPKPEKVEYKVTENFVRTFCAGKATLSKVDITVTVKGNDFTFPMYAVIPKKEGKYPFFVHINFRSDVPDRYMPSEELFDNGFAVLSFGYKDVTSDDGDFTNGLAGALYENGVRGPRDAGKIAMWAWAAQRVLDYAETVDKLDMNCATVCGHSRLGKTALLAAATDERFKFAYSNDSGCSGAAITRDKVGEKIADIHRVFPFWFCENYANYVPNVHSLPFDQHFLAASILPRYVLIGSAELDEWADPLSEMLTCVAVGPLYEKYGMKGFIYEDRLPKAGDVYLEGSIGYHNREGEHYFSREDWARLIKFINMHK